MTPSSFCSISSLIPISLSLSLSVSSLELSFFLDVFLATWIFLLIFKLVERRGENQMHVSMIDGDDDVCM